MKRPLEKSRLYKGLYVLNRGFALIVQNSRLRATRLLAEELRAQVNYTLAEALRDYEQKAWARFGRLRFPKTPDCNAQLPKDKNKIRKKEEYQHGRRKTSHNSNRSKKESLDQKGRR
jgi:hypothetical protein